jgi:iron complex transport system ATP-binding protein
MNKEGVELQQLSIGYQEKRRVKTVAAAISAVIRQGELTCLLGINGVGKSTLLRTLSGFQPKLGGAIFVEGKEIDAYTAAELSRLIGVVLTEKPAIKNMTVRELVSLGRSPYTGFWGTYSREDQQIVDQAMEQVGIGALSSRMVDTLSDGERQKVMIAKALAQQTPIIFLDEPTAFLDFPSKVDILLMLRQICQDMKKTVFLSTHDLELALQVADCIWLMDASQGISIGSPQVLAKQGKLNRFTERKGIHFDSDTLTIKIDKTA